MVMLASPLVAQFQRKAEVGEREKAQWEVWLDTAKENFDKKKTWFTDHAQVSTGLGAWADSCAQQVSYSVYEQLLLTPLWGVQCLL